MRWWTVFSLCVRLLYKVPKLQQAPRRSETCPILCWLLRGFWSKIGQKKTNLTAEVRYPLLRWYNSFQFHEHGKNFQKVKSGSPFRVLKDRFLNLTQAESTTALHQASVFFLFFRLHELMSLKLGIFHTQVRSKHCLPTARNSPQKAPLPRVLVEALLANLHHH